MVGSWLSYGSGRPEDVDGDGAVDIVVASNDCDPSCAEGTVTEEVLRWDDTLGTWALDNG